MVSRKLAIAGTAAACAACCAPLVVPLVWPALVAAGLVGTGGAVGGWLAGLSLDVILRGGLAAAAFSGSAVWLYRRRKHRQAAVTNLVDGPKCDLATCGPAPRAKSLS